jgi:hypothetical protein
VGQNHYSVPDRLVGKKIMVKLYSTRMQCFYEETKVAEHHRLTDSHEWSLQLEHVLDTLEKKPGAVAGSGLTPPDWTIAYDIAVFRQIPTPFALCHKLPPFVSPSRVALLAFGLP